MLDQDLKNGAVAPGVMTKIAANPDVVAALETALTEARDGRLVTVAIVKVAVGETIGLVSAGNLSSALVSGLEQMKLLCLQAMFPTAQRAPGGLVIPGRR